jgi:hypothetical protein
MVNDTDIVELELKSKRFNLSVKKKEALKSEQVVHQVRFFGVFSLLVLFHGSWDRSRIQPPHPFNSPTP